MPYKKDDPKKNQTRIRMSDEELTKLDYCCKAYGLTKAEAIRRGIDELYTKAKEKELL